MTNSRNCLALCSDHAINPYENILMQNTCNGSYGCFAENVLITSLRARVPYVTYGCVAQRKAAFQRAIPAGLQLFRGTIITVSALPVA